jgi:3-hydroxybutyryl-CoA dehydrogenase
MVEGVERIAVVGGGVMGNGIAQVAAQAGFATTVVDVSEEALERSLGNIKRSLARLVKRGDLTEEAAEEIAGRLSLTTDLEAAGRDADHVIEAVSEDLALKLDIFGRLDAVCAPHVVFASNTSQFAITKLASGTDRPDRVIGTHWFNPPPIMRLIEIVRGVETSDETLATTLALAKAFGKETIVCKKDTQGFVTSRLILLFNLEAMRILEEGIADVEDINKACVLAFNHAMGPLDTCDLGGLDTTVRASEGMTQHYGERFLAPQGLRALVNAGHYGRKTGRGFRSYGEKERN